MLKSKNVSYIVFLALFVFIALIASSCSQKQGLKSEDYLNFKKGNQWTYIIETKPKDTANSNTAGVKSPAPAESGKPGKENDKKNETAGKQDKSGEQIAESKNEMTFKITGVQDIDGVSCFIKETIINQDQNPREYYEINPEKGLLLHRQDFLLFNPKLGNFQLTEAKIDPPQVFMEFPLTEGKSWTRSADMGGVTLSAVFLVRGEEEVETPAGKFTALKIESHGGNSGTAGNTGGSEFTSFQWYARGVGMVKEIVQVEKGTSTTVLKEYKPGS